MNPENPNLNNLGRETIRLVRPQTEEEIRAGLPPQPAEPLIVVPGAAPPAPPTLVTPAGDRATPAIGDFIDTYAAWADVVELPRAMHEAVAIQLVASLLNMHGVYIQNGPIWYPMDLWMVLLSKSGGGRSSLLSFAKRLIDDAKIFEGMNRDFGWSPQPGLINNCRWGSAPALFQELCCYRDKNLYVWGELGEKFALLNSGPFKSYGAKQWITDLYDNRSKPDSIMYRRTGKSGDTEPIVFNFAPRINILAGSSEDWFYNNLYGDDSLGGWLPRWVFVRTGGRARSCPRPVEPDPGIVDRLAAQLRTVASCWGEATMQEDTWQDYETWYRETQHRFESHVNPALAIPYWNRHKGMILKLAVIFEASMNASSYVADDNGVRSGLTVGWKAWERSKTKCAEFETDIFEMLNTGMTAVGYTLKRYADRIRAAGSEGLLRSDFTRAFQDDEDRERHLSTLLVADRVHTFQRPGSGRTGQVFVTAESCQGRCPKCQIEGAG